MKEPYDGMEHSGILSDEKRPVISVPDRSLKLWKKMKNLFVWKKTARYAGLYPH
jgi:hypothetical protein